MEHPANPVEPWIMTFSGHGFVFEHPDPDCIVIEDIAHALSNICRYTGHVPKFYSVAQHCVLVSRMVEKQYGESFALEGLLHDSAEAYVTDVNKPLKTLLGEPYKRLETIAMKAIADKFGVPYEKSAPVAYCDGALYLAERRDLFGSMKPSFTFTHHQEKKACEEVIRPWSPFVAEQSFLNRFDEVKSW
jgi:uncharacterized protein